MKFDAMCKVAERHLPRLAAKLRYASLLRMPGIYTNDSPSLESGFRMVWEAMAIEDDQGCVFMQRTGQLSVTPGEARSEECASATVDQSVRIRTSDVGLRKRDCFDLCVTKGDMYLIYATDFTRGADTKSLTGVDCMGYSCGSLWVCSLDGRRVRMVRPEDSDRDEALRQLINDAEVGFTQSMLCAEPGRWVLREVCASPRSAYVARKIPRSHQRDRWLSITDEERVRYFRSDEREPTGRHPIAHARRAHYRHIGENDDGTKKYTWVRACWVGSTEAEIRGQKYRVELEL